MSKLDVTFLKFHKQIFHPSSLNTFIPFLNSFIVLYNHKNILKLKYQQSRMLKSEIPVLQKLSFYSFWIWCFLFVNCSKTRFLTTFETFLHISTKLCVLWYYKNRYQNFLTNHRQIFIECVKLMSEKVYKKRWHCRGRKENQLWTMKRCVLQLPAGASL